ncbi:MAG: hypothetical protein DDT37_01686 [Firmicutes bacterium]|nr:hypothetical protein [candidate division NPL-UPA2 bacterium]
MSTNAYPTASSGFLTTTDYTQSRLQNLITNGSGLMGNNYNFSTYIFSQTETHGGAGSFLHSGAHGRKFSDELMPVDGERFYRMVVWAQSGETGGANFNPLNRQYAGIAPFDIDGLSIEPFHYARFLGATDTTLAAALNPGATTVSLTSAAGWQNAGDGHQRNFIWYGYTNSRGFTYPNFTYSRLTSANFSDFIPNGVWAAGGISGNTITLRAPWPGPMLPAGSAIRNNTSGSTFKYIVFSGTFIPNTWTRGEGFIGGWDTTGSVAINLFPFGTSFVRLVFLNNYTGGISPNNSIRWSNIWFSELSSRNLELATADVPGVITLTRVDTHAALTTAHSAVSAPTASRIVMRDAAGRAQVVDGAVAADIATRGQIDAHAATSSHRYARSFMLMGG